MSTKPYTIVVWWRDGRRTIAAASHNPMSLAASHNPMSLAAVPMVARDPRVIQRIELHDLDGCLEAIWDADWR
jgi:hypothetical protein